MQTNHYDDQRQIFSVSQLNRRTRQLLETHLPLIRVEGELSNFACPASGHWYFSLKDDNAQVRCAMFRNRNNAVRLTSGGRPGNGMQVLLRCRVSLYEGRGEFQLIVEHMEEAGLGALQRRFDELKTRLAAEGLFEEERKQALPSLPHCIGVITSPTGAAIRDILSVLERRFPAIPVIIYPTAVQGQEAIEGIANAIAIANKQQRCDVLIVGRGGGSMEDLWAFNEERVARSLFDSSIPVVSAIGHEVDFTIADFVADLRAPTPSAAAELLSPDGEELLATFQGYQVLLENSVIRHIKSAQQTLLQLRLRLRHPGNRLREQTQHLDHLEVRLQSALQARMHHARTKLSELRGQLSRFHPETRLEELKQRSGHLSQRLNSALQHQLQTRKQHLSSAVQVLNAVSPLNTLGRGYSITLDSDQKVIKKIADVTVGQSVVTRISDGELHCRVEKAAKT